MNDERRRSGSYVLDPNTGVRTLVHRTGEEPQPKAEAPAVLAKRETAFQGEPPVGGATVPIVPTAPPPAVPPSAPDEPKRKTK